MTVVAAPEHNAARGAEAVFSPPASTKSSNPHGTATFRSPRPAKASAIRVVTRIRPLLPDETARGRAESITAIPCAIQPVQTDVPASANTDEETPIVSPRSSQLPKFRHSKIQPPTPQDRTLQPKKITQLKSQPLVSPKSGFQTLWPAQSATSTSLYASLGPNSKKQFDFDAVLSGEATQEQVYATAVGDKILTNIFRGINFTIMAYGQTCSGKSHTMQGTCTGNMENTCPNEPSAVSSVADHEGIIPRAIHDLFQGKTEYRSSGKGTVQIDMTYFELYNDEIRDLLQTTEDDNFRALKMLDHGNNGVVIEGLTTLSINSAEQAHELISYAADRRATASTYLNINSSRSHAVCTLAVTVTPFSKSSGTEMTQAKLTLVDLAGSERIKKSGVIGVQRDESITINKDLFVLGKVVAALASRSTKEKKEKHVPYRDSKLTRLLRESLGGNCFTVLISCVSPADFDIEESINTLRYAERARSISNTIKRNVSQALLTPAECTALTQENMRLKVLVAKLKKRVAAELSRDAAGSLLDKEDEDDSAKTHSEIFRIDSQSTASSVSYPATGLSEKRSDEPIWMHFKDLAKITKNVPIVKEPPREIELGNRSDAGKGVQTSSIATPCEPQRCLSYELSLAACGTDDNLIDQSQVSDNNSKLHADTNAKLQAEVNSLRKVLNSLKLECGETEDAVVKGKRDLQLVLDNLDAAQQAENEREACILEKNHELQILSSRVDALREEQNNKESCISEKIQELQNLSSKVDSSKLQESKREACISAKNERLQNLSLKVDALRQEKMEREVCLSGKNLELQNLTSRADALKVEEAEREDCISRKNKELQSLASLVDALRQEQSEKEASMLGKNQELQDLTMKVNALKLEASEREACISGKNKELQNLSAKVDAFKLQATETVTFFSKKKQDLLDLSSKLDALRLQEREGEASISVKNEELQRLSSEVKALKLEVRASQDALMEGQQAMEELSENVETTKRKTKEAGDRLLRESKELQNLSMQVDTLKKEDSECQRAVLQRQQELQHLAVEVKNLRMEASEAQNCILKKKQELKELSEKVDALKGQEKEIETSTNQGQEDLQAVLDQVDTLKLTRREIETSIVHGRQDLHGISERVLALKNEQRGSENRVQKLKKDLHTLIATKKDELAAVAADVDLEVAKRDKLRDEASQLKGLINTLTTEINLLDVSSPQRSFSRIWDTLEQQKAKGTPPHLQLEATATQLQELEMQLVDHPDKCLKGPSPKLLLADPQTTIEEQMRETTQEKFLMDHQITCLQEKNSKLESEVVLLKDEKEQLKLRAANDVHARAALEATLMSDIAKVEEEKVFLRKEVQALEEKILMQGTSEQSAPQIGTLQILANIADSESEGIHGDSPQSMERDYIKMKTDKMLQSAAAAVDGMSTSRLSTATSSCSSAGTDFLPPAPGQPKTMPVLEKKDWALSSSNSDEIQITNLAIVEDQKICSCSSSLFCEQTEYVDFYLPLIKLECTCGFEEPQEAKEKDGMDKADPGALESILRPWQCEFLADQGIHDALSLIRTNYQRGGKLAKDLRKWRKAKGLAVIRTKSCGVALHIWGRTCKGVLSSLKKQRDEGVPVPRRPEFLELNISENNTAISSLG